MTAESFTALCRKLEARRMLRRDPSLWLALRALGLE
jgi:hypothetical protein